MGTAKITPVFVLGLQRSGTTWIANMLCAHPCIAGVQAEFHHGIHESIFFSHFARSYGDLEDEENFESFVNDFTTSDYFLLSGVDESWYRAQRPRDSASAFRILMDEVARKRGASNWVEKSPHHALMFHALADSFPDARFVCVIRDSIQLVRSRLWAHGRRPSPYPSRFMSICRACAANALYSRSLKQYCTESPCAILLTYQAVAENPEQEMRRVCAFLDLPFTPVMLRSRYAPNTSFRTSKDRADALGPLDRAAVRTLSFLCSVLPLATLANVNQQRTTAESVTWPDWCWTLRPRPRRAEPLQSRTDFLRK